MGTIFTLLYVINLSGPGHFPVSDVHQLQFKTEAQCQQARQLLALNLNIYNPGQCFAQTAEIPQ
jgi:hypothetical protein